MAARYLLDSDICVVMLSGRHPNLVRTFDRKLPGHIAVSVIVMGELLAGAEKSRDPLAAKQRIAALANSDICSRKMYVMITTRPLFRPRLFRCRLTGSR